MRACSPPWLQKALSEREKLSLIKASEGLCAHYYCYKMTNLNCDIKKPSANVFGA